MNGWMIYVLASHAFSTLVTIAMIRKPRKVVTTTDALGAFVALVIVLVIAVVTA